MFNTYLQLGFQHIADVNAYDHILFIVALCAVYQIHQWRQILILVTAFTLGHSITLALATLKLVVFPADIIEFLIPVTILLTCIYNVIVRKKEYSQAKFKGNYLLVTFFGLIHGLGFSNYLRALLGREESIVQPLLAFNIGLEIGQLLIVAITLIISFIVLNLFKAKHREWNLFISGAAAGIALILIKNSPLF